MAAEGACLSPALPRATLKPCAPYNHSSSLSNAAGQTSPSMLYSSSIIRRYYLVIIHEDVYLDYIIIGDVTP